MSEPITVSDCPLCEGRGTRDCAGLCVCGIGRRLAAWFDYWLTPEDRRVIVLEAPELESAE